MVGSGKPIDTDKYFVVCSNVIGGCVGSFSPKEINPKTGQPYALDFPVITIADMVSAQKLLIDHLGINKLHAIIGGSMGGFQALQWAISYPNFAKAIVPIAASYRYSTQNIAFNEVARQAIMVDPAWCEGKYLTKEKYDWLLTKLIGEGYHWPSKFDKSQFFEIYAFCGLNEYGDIHLFDFLS